MRLIIMALVLVVAAVVYSLSLNDLEPRYEGRSLSHWIEAYEKDKGEQATKALQSIGTNALPFLLHWIRNPEPKHHTSLRPIARKLPRLFQPKWARKGYRPPRRSDLSAWAFHALGSQASPVVPELARLAADRKNANVAELALEALWDIGSNGVPALITVARDRFHPRRGLAVIALGLSRDLGPYTNVVVTELITFLEDRGVQCWAAYALSHLRVRPELVVPALVRRLEKTNTDANFRNRAVEALDSFRRKAANALNDSNIRVREEATNTIQTIHLAKIRSETRD
ncbi:MAG: hypothetical protein L0Y58_18355 [Verrucomicrobia subdivision 3 bacterium]|nr:hypothetical protein [Limisphaerales bacterium]